MQNGNVRRRDFLKSAAAAGMALAVSNAVAEPPAKPRKMIGIQIGSISFIDESLDQVLDTVQERGNAKTNFLATLTHRPGIAGRQVPGQPLPDHGVQEYDEKFFHGGNYATPHARFYEKTTLKETKAPDHGPDVDILEMVLPKAKKRGVQVYCWYEDSFRGDI